MTLTLPFTCKQFEKFALLLWWGIQASILIGLFALIGFGIYIDDPAFILLGVIFSIFAWLMRIVFWVDDGKIKCKPCEEDKV